MIFALVGLALALIICGLILWVQNRGGDFDRPLADRAAEMERTLASLAPLSQGRRPR